MKMKTTLDVSATFLLLLCCGPLAVLASLTESPLNDAVLVGSTVTLRCSASGAPPSTRITWTEFASQSAGVILSDGKTIIASHPSASRYSISQGELDYHLTITNVTLGDGGMYLCQDINSAPPSTYRGYAELIVLASDPECLDFVTVTGVVIEGRSYSSECEVGYRGNVAPVMEWAGPGNFITNGSTTPESVWHWKRFTAERSMDGEVYTCFTQFPPIVADPGHANNTPTYQHTYTSPVLQVRWYAQNMQVTPIKDVYQVGDVLTCTADSNPPASFVWTNMRTLVAEPPSPTFTVTSDLAGFDQVMRCHAEVIIEGSMASADIFVNVSVPAATTPSTTTVTTPAPADGPCSDPTGRWASTNPNAVVCIEVGSKGDLLALIRNGSDPYFVAGNGKSMIDDYKHIGFTAVWPTGRGVGGFTGECHKCFGDEVILLSGLSRNKAEAPDCGQSAGTHLIPQYVLTRVGPPCRGLELDVYNPKPWVYNDMGIKARPYTL